MLDSYNRCNEANCRQRRTGDARGEAVPAREGVTKSFFCRAIIWSETDTCMHGTEWVALHNMMCFCLCVFVVQQIHKEI